MEYIYRIHNLITNKDYVGLTNNPKRRESRHFTDLKYGRHDNPHLQRAYNKYGREAFVYEVLQSYDCSEEEIKEHGNIINGITIPLIIPYLERALLHESPDFSSWVGIINCFNVESPERM